jgi:hypothetical protein
MEKSAEDVVPQADMGSFDCVRLAPDFDQEDRALIFSQMYSIRRSS